MSSSSIRKHLVPFVFAVAVIAMIAVTALTMNVYATAEYWAVNVGGTDAAFLKSEDDANQVIEALRKEYVKDDSANVVVSIDPEITIVRKYYKPQEEPQISTVEEAADQILGLKDEKGDAVCEVTVTQTFVKKSTISYKTKYVDDPSALVGTETVKTEGKDGVMKKSVTVVTVNGKKAEQTINSRKVVKEPVTKVIAKGTKEPEPEPAAEETPAPLPQQPTQTQQQPQQQTQTQTQQQPQQQTQPQQPAQPQHQQQTGSKYEPQDVPAKGSATGQQVAEYAQLWIGNPYVYGGTSLTNGADCSGFTMTVFKHFGVSLPHGARSQGAYGKSVGSLANAVPGDLIVFAKGHVGIYVGNGYMVHASQPGVGIVRTPAVNSGTISTIRRLV